LDNCEGLSTFAHFLRFFNDVKRRNKFKRPLEMGSYKTLVVNKTAKIFRITFNRPERKNAVSIDMYNEIMAALDESAKADTLLTVFTGKGDYYSSGNDLANFMVKDINELEQRRREARGLLKRYVAAFIDHPKPLVALVNGPALGIAVTVLGMFDLVYASNNATFETPFGRLALLPEGASTFTFPRLMGISRATEVLLFNRKLTAEDAKRYGLVNEVFPSDSFVAETNSRLEVFSQLAHQNIIGSRKLIRDQFNKDLHNANETECKAGEDGWHSEEAMNAVLKFFNRSKI